MEPKRILITGAAGFIGSHLMRWFLNKEAVETVVGIDIGSRTSDMEDLFEDLQRNYFERGHLYQYDIGDPTLVGSLLKKYAIDCVINCAAESHNSRARLNPDIFFETNVLKTISFAHTCLKVNPEIHFHHVSTCEVYGDSGLEAPTLFFENSSLPAPTGPYSQSKWFGESALLELSRLAGLRLTVTRGSNTIGSREAERIIPLHAMYALKGEPVPLYEGSDKVSRPWIDVIDHCRGIELAIRKGFVGQVYNLPGPSKTNREVSEAIVSACGANLDLITEVPCRPGNDSAYFMNKSKVYNQLGWEPEVSFGSSIRNFASWAKCNLAWLEQRHQTINEFAWGDKGTAEVVVVE